MASAWWTARFSQFSTIPKLDQQYFQPTDTTSVCGWKGTANYYDIVVDGQVNSGAAWYYADPRPEAENIRGYVAFWKGVEIR